MGTSEACNDSQQRQNAAGLGAPRRKYGESRATARLRYSLVPQETSGSLLAYGMGPRRLYEQLNGLGHKISLEECRALFDKYKQTFKTTIGWLDANKREARKNLVMTNIAGRKRWWEAPNTARIRAILKAEMLKKTRKQELTSPEERKLQELTYEKVNNQWAGIEREGANFKVQSTNVEWTKPAMKEIKRACKKRGYDARMYNSVYDETVMDSHKSCAEEVFELQKKIMIECGQKYCKKVPVEVEGHLKPYWTK